MAVMVALIVLMSGCASQGQSAKTHEHLAVQYESNAKEWQATGNEAMAKYYEHKAEVERHNSIAESCGFFDTVFDVILSSDACIGK